MNEKGKIMSVSTYIVCANKPWYREVFDSMLAKLPGHWIFLDSVDALTVERLAHENPEYVFFLHWSHKVPEAIYEKFECVCFHMTDVPYGRGGSPLQNLIVRGHRSTKLTALRMVEEMDAGPVYFKRELSLEGNAEEVFIRAGQLAAEMAKIIVQEKMCPVEQIGEATVFKRRKPAESEIPAVNSLTQLHDFIRMLDAEGYPHAFIEHQGFRYEFRRAARYDGRIEADVVITPLEKV